MSRKNPPPLLPYLLLGLLVMAAQPLLSWYNRYTAEEIVTIEYLPEGASQPVVYRVAAENVQRSGGCITFPSGKNQDSETLTLCERYREVTQE